MHLLHGLDAFSKLPDGAALSVGNFDGVHLGHRRIIDTLRDFDPSAVVVVTFEPHPLSVLRPELAPPRLSPQPIKHGLLEEAGVTHLIELEPTDAVLGVTAQAFWEMLRDQARPAHLAEGPDFTFGKAAAGNVETLRRWAEGTSVDVHVVEPLQVALPGLQVVPVSSSLVRWLVTRGRVADVAACLGRPYTLRGTVVEGYKRGREIGFPTANLETHQLVPADGVYAGTAWFNGHSRSAAITVGTAPHFGTMRRQVEAHLLDFDGDLYGRVLDLELHHWVRDMMKFPDLPALVGRIERDVRITRESASRMAATA